ncbi:MAG: putative bifunctional diguanylate cyclase/phosphodiesterase [Methylotenera sp.]
MSETTASRIATISRVYLIITLFVVLIFCLVLLIQVQMNVLTAIRAYVGGEGLWAKAQKDAIRSLEHYAISRDEADYQSFRRFIQVPLGDLKARNELQNPNPNLDIAREGFLKGHNHPVDIEYMITFFHRFQHTAYMTQAIGHWTAADQLIAELNGVAEKIHDEIASGRDKPEAVRAFLTKLDTINLQVTEKEDLFSSTLADASRWANDVSRNLTYAIALLFSVLGVGICWPTITRIRATEKELFESEADLRIAATAFESQESLMITDANSVILRVNQAFTENTGYTAEEAVGQTPRLFKSGRHNADFYRAMWETLQRTGIWQGEVWDQRKNGEVFPKWLTISAVKGNNGVVTHYVGSHIDITERKVAEDAIKNLAFYDTLTHLPNRRLLFDRLRQALASSARSGREGALLFIDLDDFKTLNDTHGHDVGDLLLQQVAERLTANLREGDTVARLGGDEFVVMLENLSKQSIKAAAQTKAIGDKILAALNRPYQIDANEHHSTPSIGATLFNDHQSGIEELLKQADIAMYQAKKAGRNALRFFDPQMQVAINARVSLEGELRKALEQHQFQLYYQIQVDGSHRPLGAEALIRWLHPERGLVPPIQFIPLAEETGLILPIGQWVLGTACAQLKVWQQDALTLDLILSVNVSAKQFRQTDFVAQVQAAVQRHAINPMRLKLELTESMLLERIDDTIATMNALKEIGIRFSLDDFGTGYSSLQYLKRLPLYQLKIDQSFVRDIAIDNSDQVIVRTIIAMAHSLELDVIAEGVETEEQRQLLLNQDCTHFQGYLFSRPVPIAQFEALLKKG